ncbi:hypothetical protein [Bacillus sp. V59.32b]|uniref:hypothetical protein n=1 Tax=Bacillus sp. V59.32b TaxID=1758642 RepID=UPI000E3B7D16|nr:hypothetical protein [Bacillus sp. V59.32b]RFU68195.1 hypothetical protein D0463_05405 [Bacillus sp. V59.32b]
MSSDTAGREVSSRFTIRNFDFVAGMTHFVAKTQTFVAGIPFLLPVPGFVAETRTFVAGISFLLPIPFL